MLNPDRPDDRMNYLSPGGGGFGQTPTATDWAMTMNRLLSLAKQANDSFEFDKALGYLGSLEEMWNAKGLPGFSMELRFELHREKGKAYTSQGNYSRAIEEYQKILNFCRDNQYLAVKSETFTQIGQLLARQGDHDRALGYHQRAIGACRRLNDRNGLCKALRNLGVVYVELGDFEEAETTYAEAIEVAREIDNSLVYADLVNNLGTIMNMKGDWHKALELYRESLEIYGEKGEIRKSAYTKNNIAISYAVFCLKKKNYKFLKEALETAEKIKDSSLTLIVDLNLAEHYLKNSNVANAQIHCQRALDHLIEANIVNIHLVEAKKIAGMIAHQCGDFDEAVTHFAAALEISRQTGARYQEAEVLRERGKLYRATGEHLNALTDLEQSYHIYTCLNADGKREQAEDDIYSIEKLYLETFHDMAMKIDQKDKYTKGHSDRVAALSLLLARELGLQPSLLKTIVAASLLHDIGKIRIADDVLKKAGRLTNEEFEQIKRHSEYSVELLRGMEFPWDIKPLMMAHHEKLDGTGYPLGLKGEDIPMGARIISIADVFDALTSDRVYRPAYSVQKALDIMQKDSGTAFDPVLLMCFVNVIESGKADAVINAQTHDDEIFQIWSQCMSNTAA